MMPSEIEFMGRAIRFEFAVQTKGRRNMKVDLTTQEASLLMELMQEWKMHRRYHIDEMDIINGIVAKIYQSLK